MNTVRVFEDGDYVFAHTDYNFFGPKIGFDIFRFENGRIVEHWDNLQETTGPNPNGHTMTDGPTEVHDPAKTDANKAVVRAFVDDVLVHGRVTGLPATSMVIATFSTTRTSATTSQDCQAPSRQWQPRGSL